MLQGVSSDGPGVTAAVTVRSDRDGTVRYSKVPSSRAGLGRPMIGPTQGRPDPGRGCSAGGPHDPGIMALQLAAPPSGIRCSPAPVGRRRGWAAAPYRTVSTVPYGTVQPGTAAVRSDQSATTGRDCRSDASFRVKFFKLLSHESAGSAPATVGVSAALALYATRRDSAASQLALRPGRVRSDRQTLPLPGSTVEGLIVTRDCLSSSPARPPGRPAQPGPTAGVTSLPGSPGPGY
eukprot:750671-Hanusia_phi.AAC.5